jgi:hypothetical protein
MIASTPIVGVLAVRLAVRTCAGRSAVPNVRGVAARAPIRGGGFGDAGARVRDAGRDAGAGSSDPRITPNANGPPRQTSQGGPCVFREWAWHDSNVRPHAYQACALTT